MATVAAKKFRELILYICLKSELDAAFGLVKLYKDLFFADLDAYRNIGHTITGQTYQKLPQGPAPRRAKPVLREMQRADELVIRERAVWSYVQQRPFALREPDLGLFDEREIAITDDVIARYADASAASISDASHDFLGWQLADIGEDIPFSVAFVNLRPLTDEERAYALTLDNLPDYVRKR